LLLVVLSIIGLNAFFNKFYLISPIELQNPVRIRGGIYPIKITEPELDAIIDKEVKNQVQTSSPTPVKTRENDKTSGVLKGTWEGQASVYTEEGCLGCNEGLIMANLERLDYTKLTLAMLPEVVKAKKLLNKMVQVTNVKNGLVVIAKVTDTGGFGRYNRVADLNKATADAINCKGLCQVKVEEI
jgi:rare lipoprotein A (peptidoglycan hydrolase)